MAGESASFYGSVRRMSQDDAGVVAPASSMSASVEDSQDSQGSSIEEVIDWAKVAAKHDAQKPPLPACLVQAVESTAENLVLSSQPAPVPSPVESSLALVAHHDPMPTHHPGFQVPRDATEHSAAGPEVHKADDEVKVNISVEIEKFQSIHEYHMHHHHYHYHTHRHEKPNQGCQNGRGDDLGDSDHDADSHDACSDFTDHVASGEDDNTHVTILRSVTVTPLSSGKFDNPTETKEEGSKHGATTWAAHGKGQQSKWKHHHHHLHSSKRRFCDEEHGRAPSGSNETSDASIKLRRMTHHISCDK